MFRNKVKKRLPPWPIRLIKHLLAKLSQFFNADDSDRFRDRLTALVIDSANILEFFKWHTPPLAGFQRIWAD
jgi:hypothetical protein